MTVQSLISCLWRVRSTQLRRPEPVVVPLSLSQLYALERGASRLGVSPGRLARLLLLAALAELRGALGDELGAEDRADFIQRRQSELDSAADKMQRGLAEFSSQMPKKSSKG